MGNQLPTKCVTPCHPQCCAMCIHGEDGRLEDPEDQSGSGRQKQKAKTNIFANAASVLSMAAEEISLDDHLEKELANEVELWRMETSSSAVQKTAYGGFGFRSDVKGLGGAAATSGAHFMVPFADKRTPRDRSVSPPPRTQVSLHNRVGLGGSSGARPASGTKQASPVPRRPAPSSGMDLASTLAAQQRPGASAPPRARPGALAAEGGATETPHPAGAAASSSSDRPPPAGAASAAAAHGATIAGAGAPGSSADATAGGAGAGAAAAHEEAAVQRLSFEAVKDLEGPVLEKQQPASTPAVDAGDGLSEGFPDPAADVREVEIQSSSDESTFIGFIEDPLETERVGEIWSVHDQQAWLGDPLHGRSQSNQSEVEDVRPDRANF